MAKKRVAIEATLKANDYNAFVIARTAHKPTVPTQEEFTKIVAKHAEIKEDRKELKNDRKDLKDMVKNKKKAKQKKRSKK